MIAEQRQVLVVATALSVFWVLTLVVAGVSRGGDTTHFAFAVATLVFLLLAPPSLLFAYINRWLAFAGILAGIALLIDTGIVFLWVLA
jgi:hypothetical protein